ncbi:MAG: rod shape-determining protein RodA [Cardiobacteriaceae bacterium]|nr:rod shape-determining protein RodA [Cardiobacteriaceae bacterium]
MWNNKPLLPTQSALLGFGQSSHIHRPYWSKLDGWLLLMYLLLMSFSLVVLHSSSGGEGTTVLRQTIRFGGGWLLFALVLGLKEQHIRRATPYLFGLTVVLLLLVLVAGTEAGGAKRWLNLGFARIQPSELAKITVPMMVAWFATITYRPLSALDIVMGLLLIAIPAALIFKEPDLGTTLLVTASGLIALFLAGLPWLLIAGFVLIVLTGAPLFWLYGIKEYQRDRVMTFLNPEADPWGKGYHITQSKIAIGSGGVEGKGYMQGTQSQLEFLPESSTDFIFSVIGEEFGLIGVSCLLLLYAVIIYRGLYLATRLQDRFAQIVSSAIYLSFFINIFVNIGMVSGLLPVVGLPLALISYGGSSVLSLMVGFALAMNLSASHRDSPATERLAHYNSR